MQKLLQGKVRYDGRTRLIVTTFEYPPIPIRTCDYRATFEDYDLGDRQGWGPTPAAAIDDLLDWIDLDYEYVFVMGTEGQTVVHTDEFTNDSRDQAAVCWIRL